MLTFHGAKNITISKDGKMNIESVEKMEVRFEPQDDLKHTEPEPYVENSVPKPEFTTIQIKNVHPGFSPEGIRSLCESYCSGAKIFDMEWSPNSSGISMIISFKVLSKYAKDIIENMHNKIYGNRIVTVEEFNPLMSNVILTISNLPLHYSWGEIQLLCAAVSINFDIKFEECGVIDDSTYYKIKVPKKFSPNLIKFLDGKLVDNKAISVSNKAISVS